MTTYVFDHWELDGVNQGSVIPFTTTITADQSLIAVYTIQTVQQTLTVLPATGGVTDPITGIYVCNQGVTVTIAAIPDIDYMFDHWELDGVSVSTASSYTVTMDTDHTLRAVFVATPPPPPGKHNLTISATIGGTTTPEAGTWEFNEGVSIQVRANPDNNYSFDHWELDGVVSKDNPITITMDIDHSLLATFTAKPVPIPLWQVATAIFSLVGVTGLVISKA